MVYTIVYLHVPSEAEFGLKNALIFSEAQNLCRRIPCVKKDTQ